MRSPAPRAEVMTLPALLDVRTGFQECSDQALIPAFSLDAADPTVC